MVPSKRNHTVLTLTSSNFIFSCFVTYYLVTKEKWEVFMCKKNMPAAYKKLLSLVFGLACLSSSVAQGKTFDAIYSVGDSLTDPGAFEFDVYNLNNDRFHGPFSMGRFTVNPGHVYAMDLADKFGLQNTANLYNNSNLGKQIFLGGTNYAQGDARVATDNNVLNLLFPKPITKQVAALLEDTGGKISSKALVTILGGDNDIQLGFPPDFPPADSVVEAGAILGDLVQQLKSAGAKHLLVFLAPNPANTPKAYGQPAAQAELTNLTNLFNAALLEGIKGTNAVVLDINKIFLNIINDPVRFGFAPINHFTDYAAKHAVNLPFAASSPGISIFLVQGENLFVDGNSFIFADSAHPSPRTHQILADTIYSILRAPGFVGAIPNIVLGNSLQFMHGIESSLYALQNLGCGEAQECHKKFSIYTNYEFTDVRLNDEGFLQPAVTNLTNGAVIGGNYFFSPSMILGAAFNYQNIFGKVSSNRGHFRLNQYTLALYTQGSFCCNWTGYASLSGGYLDGNSVRKDSVGVALLRANGNIRGQVWAGEGGFRYQMRSGRWASGPKLSYLYDYVRTNGFTEKGDFTALKYRSMHINTSRINLGWDTEYGLSCDWVRPFFQLAYEWGLGPEKFRVNYGMVTYSHVQIDNLFSDAFNLNGGVKFKISRLFDIFVQGGFNWFWSNSYIGNLNVGFDLTW